MLVMSTDELQANTGQSRVRDYVALLKPRVMSLVVFTGIAGIYLAPGTIHPFIAFVAVMCITIASGASGAINMWYDADIDAIMKRTQSRPIPMGLVPGVEALSFGIILALASVLIMGLAVNVVAALLLASAILFYVFVYTMYLKRRTPQNIVIGGAAGAFPPMIGWAAVTGSVSIESILLFALIFMWTPPHFWALALYKSDDYSRAGVPMLPVVAGDRSTRNHILVYTLLLYPLTLAPVVIGMSGIVYGVIALLLGGAFVWHALRVFRDTPETVLAVPHARAMFGFSILYLFALFLGLMIDARFYVALPY
ncbi:MAG: protoheme farnesyltransferase [Rickettsiales bacterium]|jgi:protoheme IX farnesyltransferase|nr:protoheme farnesyltransferase [Rickettsiales bacterium]